MQRVAGAMGIAIGLTCSGCAPAVIAAGAAPSEGYKYALTPQAAHQCKIVQERLSAAKRDTDAEWARYHKAMALTWERVGSDLNFASPAGFKAPASGLTIAELAELARPCEIMSRIHPAYSAASFAIEESDRAIFADNAARKFQTGGKPAELPKKDIAFDKWQFSASGNSCRATHTFADGAKLTLGFTNFFDGALRFEWDQLPVLDIESDDYEAAYALHRAGSDYNDDSLAVFADGVTYPSYPGTAIFVDDQVVAIPSAGQSKPQEYRFGAYVQKPYYNLLAEGRTLSIKVLGKETHRLDIEDPSFWNEFSNCVAQYPFG